MMVLVEIEERDAGTSCLMRREPTESARMNVQQAPIAITEGREQQSFARVPERWIVLTRAIWIILFVLTLAIFFASLPTYLAQLQTPCTEISCEYQQLTHSQAVILEGIGLPITSYAAFTISLAFVSILMCLVVSTLIIWHRPDDRMAFFVALMLITLGPIIEFVNVPLSSPSPWLVPNLCMSLLAQTLLVLVFLLFPSGRFVPRWTRWTFLVYLVLQIPLTLLPFAPLLQNNPESQFGWFVAIGGFVLIAAVQFYRYRRVSGPRERQQTKWVVFGLAVPIAINIIATVLVLFFPMLFERSPLYLLALNEIGFLIPLFISLSFGFAMLRSRLWDIDIIINRTLVYATLTVILALIYFGLIFALQFLFQGFFRQNNAVAIVVSTLAIAALFQPLRHRIQVIIDRRFYRHKYDAAKIVEGFSATLRNEVDLNQLREHLITVVQDTMQPSHVSLWLREPASKLPPPDRNQPR
jgi:hypothetical protein